MAMRLPGLAKARGLILTNSSPRMAFQPIHMETCCKENRGFKLFTIGFKLCTIGFKLLTIGFKLFFNWF
jgi:hypothetical protein